MRIYFQNFLAKSGVKEKKEEQAKEKLNYFHRFLDFDIKFRWKNKNKLKTTNIKIF